MTKNNEVEKEMDKNTQENLKILALNLDDELNAIRCDVIALNDIRSLVAELRLKMDSIEEEHARGYFNEFHRSVRILDVLCVSAMGSLNTNHAAAEDVKREMWERSEQQKSPTHGNAKD